MMSLEIMVWFAGCLKKHWRVWALLVGVGMAAVGLVWYGARQYDAGHAAATNKIRTEQQAAVVEAEQAAREQERAARLVYDRERQKWYDEKLKMQSDIADLRGNTERLQRIISASKASHLATGPKPGTTAGADPSAQAAWVVLGECVSEYETLAANADDLNSRLSIAQRWAKSLPD